MKKNDISQIEKEIEEKTTLPNEIKNRLMKTIFENFVLGIAIIVFFLYGIIGGIFAEAANLSLIYKIVSALILTLSIVLLEIAYKKDNGYIALNALEILFLACTILFIPYTFLNGNECQRKSTILISIYMILYYFIKAIIIYNYEKKKNVKANSDIKEIIEKSDKELIKEEKEKRISKVRTQKATKKGATKETITKNKITATKINSKTKTKTNDIKNESKPVKSINKKDGKAKTEKKDKMDDLQNEIKVIPKKRGRPRKDSVVK